MVGAGSASEQAATVEITLLQSGGGKGDVCERGKGLDEGECEKDVDNKRLKYTYVEWGLRKK